MSVKDLDDILVARPEAHAGTRHALADVPVAPPKGRRPAVERIAEHGAGLDGPAAQQGQAAAKGAAVVELAMGQNGGGGLADGAVVGLGPALLEADDVGRGVEEGELAADFREARRAEGRDVDEAPAVEGEEADLGDGGVGGGGLLRG